MPLLCPDVAGLTLYIILYLCIMCAMSVAAISASTGASVFFTQWRLQLLYDHSHDDDEDNVALVFGLALGESSERRLTSDAIILTFMAKTCSDGVEGRGCTLPLSCNRFHLR